MKSNYKRLGEYIQLVNNRDISKKVSLLLGVSIQKKFMPSIANIIGTDMSTYKIVRKNQFAYGPVTSRNGDKISIALLQEADEAIVSQAYLPFEVANTNKLNPEYLMMWFKRPEFDRYARFMSHGSAREIFSWEDMCNVELPIPHIDKQKEIVKEYNTIVNRIELNNQLIQKLEETAQAIYKQWFVEFEFPDENGKPYKSSGGEMVYNEDLQKEIPKKWKFSTLGKILTLNYGKALPQNSRLNDGNIKVYSSAGQFGYCDIAQSNGPSVIVGRKGSIGTVFFEESPIFCIDTAYYITESDSKFPLIFTYDILQKLDLKNMNEDSAVPGLNRNTVYTIKIIIPDKTTLFYYTSLLSTIYKKIGNLKKQNKKLIMLQETLLSKLATLN